MPDYEDLVAQLSGVRIGQNDKGRTANVSGTLLKSVLGNRWLNLTKHEQAVLVSESTPILRNEYESYLRRDYRTKEAARIVVKAEHERLTQKYADEG